MAAVDGSGAKLPENIARLPPKLRERLLKRGILKEQDLTGAAMVEERQAPTDKKPAGGGDVPAATAPAPNQPGSRIASKIESLKQQLQTMGGASKAAEEPAEAKPEPAQEPAEAKPEPAQEDAAAEDDDSALLKMCGTPPGSPAEAPESPDGGDDDDALLAMCGTPPESEAPAAAPGTPPEPASGAPGTPPEPAAGAPGTPPDSAAGALSKAAPPAPGSLCKAPPAAGSLSKAAPPAPGSISKAAFPAPAAPASALLAGAFNLQQDLALLQEKRRQAWLEAQTATPLQVEAHMATASAKKAPKPVKSVYSSAPVLKTKASVAEAEKRAAEEAAEDEPDAKKQAVQSPANLRAAAAKASGEASAAPVFVFEKDEDGRVNQISGSGQQAQPAQAAAPAVAASPAVAAMPQTAFACAAMPPPAGPPPPSGPPLPPGWVRVPHEGDFYYWNTVTQETSWEHPAEPKIEPKKEVFKEEHRILIADVGKVIGRQGINLKIIKESIGATVNIPRAKSSSKGGGKGKKGKDGKTKRGPPEGAICGAGDGSKPIPDDQFVTVTITADTAHVARGGKRCIEVMLGYGRRIEGALEALGVEVKYPKLLDEVKDSGPKQKGEDEIDPMDPSSYSDAPQGGWSSGIKKSGDRSGGGAPEPRDSRQANAERF